MTPLDALAELLEKYGHDEWTSRIRSLVAREDLGVDEFWADLAAPEIFGRERSLAALELGGAVEAPDAERVRDRERFRRALFEIADDLALRGLGTPDSDWWAEQQRTSPR